MSHVLHIADDAFRVMTTLAAERKQTPEQLLRALLDAAWEEACAKYDAAFEQDAGWLAGAQAALAEADAGQVNSYRRGLTDDDGANGQLVGIHLSGFPPLIGGFVGDAHLSGIRTQFHANSMP
jgi:hypothetical protein